MLHKVGLLTQGMHGGTDRILNDFRDWLNEKSFDVAILNDGQQHRLIEIEFLVLPTSELDWLWKNRNELNKNCRVMIWCMGHDALQAYFYNDAIQSRAYKKLFSYLYCSFTKKLICRNALTYTDLIAANLDLNNLHMPLVELCDNIYPIPILIPAPQVESNNFDCKKALSFFWLGRVDRDFKVWSLLELLDELNIGVNKAQVKITFKIVGSGDGLDLIDDKNYLFEVDKLGSLEYKQMESVIRTEANLVFAMGTSAIEGARQCVPTIIVNPLKKNEKNVTYRWVYHSVGCSLGEFKNCFVYPDQKDESLELILEQFMEDSAVVASKSYNYSKTFDRNDIYNSIMNASSGRPVFSVIKNSMFIPYFSSQFKKLIRFVIAKK